VPPPRPTRARQAAICVVDYRGFGQSAGLPDTDGLHHDARRMFEHLIGHLHVPQQKLVLHGYATGATVAAELAACLADEGQGLLGGIVYDRPMASALATVVGDQSTGLGWLGGLLDEADSVSEHHQDLAHTLARIDRRVQTLLIRGEKDALGVSGVHLRRALAALGFDFDEAKLAVDAAHNGYDMLACCSGCIATLCAHAKGA
jgi:acetyl esterase/lipase